MCACELPNGLGKSKKPSKSKLRLSIYITNQIKCNLLKGFLNLRRLVRPQDVPRAERSPSGLNVVRGTVGGVVGGVVLVSGATAAMIETKIDTEHFFRTNNLQDLQHKQIADAQCCQFQLSMCCTKHHVDKLHHHWKTLSHAHQCQIILIATIHNRL